jgi:hypothetical protein
MVQSAPSAARLRGIRAGSASGAPGRAPHNPPVVSSSPTRPTWDLLFWTLVSRTDSWTAVSAAMNRRVMAINPAGHVEQLPSGSWRVKVYARKDRICENPRLIPLVVRVLYTAGMTGQDAILRALGATLGDAVREPEKIDEAELLLIGMTNLRRHHIVILGIMTKSPHPANPSKVTYWTPERLADESNYDLYLVNTCATGLTQSGLIIQAGDAYGVFYNISDLGRIALEVWTVSMMSHLAIRGCRP